MVGVPPEVALCFLRFRLCTAADFPERRFRADDGVIGVEEDRRTSSSGMREKTSISCIASMLLSFSCSVLRAYYWGEETAMIRIEGIPIVAARLAAARRAKSAQTRDKRGTTSKTYAGVKPPLVTHGKSKAA